MSYLSHRLRLHFAGRFQATVSTVNNDVTHFNIQTFKPSYQERQDKLHLNGWWNPDGDGVWRLLGCGITTAYLADGSPVVSNDPILTLSVADSDDSAPAKIVDLDPQQQMASTLFGLQVRLADNAGNTVMRGHFAPSAFTELWSKLSSSSGGDAAYGAMWQSVITVTEWGDVSQSPFLQALQAEAQQNSNLLSIKFNVDCYSMSWPNAGQPGGNQFCRGRIVGTIGPALTSEPRRFVAGRQLLVMDTDSNQNPWINYCAAVVDQSANVVRLDLGNAMVVDGTGVPVDRGALALVVTPESGGTPQTLGTIAYTTPGWYEQTAGIVEVGIPAGLATTVASNSLGLTLAAAGTQVVTGEPLAQTSNGQTYPGGLYVRADLFVYRLSLNEQKPVTFYATRYGQAYAQQVINFQPDNSGLQVSRGEPAVGTPANGLSYPSSLTTDSQGKASLTLTGGNPQNPRQYIDGQVYGVGYSLANQSPNYPANGWNFLSVLVFNTFTPDQPTTWYGSMQPIFQQYANLYPVMARFVDLGNYEQVKSYARMLQMAFSLPEEDANAMPVTRDLSPAKRAAILQWLNNPLEGTPPAQPIALEATPSEPTPEVVAAAQQGGKTAAMARRLGRR